VKGNLQINTRMLPTSQSYLHNSSLWISCCRRMCVPCVTKRRGETFSSLPCTHFKRAIHAPFSRLSGCSCINCGKGCTNELRTPPEARDYHLLSSSCICSRNKASKALRTMGPSLSIRSSAGFNGIRAIHTCLEGIGLDLQTSQR
jgi:hypothetical protein